MNAQTDTYIPINNSCERGLRAALRSYLLGRNINGGRCPVAPDARVKLTGEQASWLNVVCNHDWPEYQAVAWAERTVPGNELVVQLWHTGAYSPAVRELQELLNRLDQFRDARDAAEFDAECIRSGIRKPGALSTPLGRAIVRDIRGATGKDTTDAHRYGGLAEDIVPVTAVCVCGATNADDCRDASEHPCARV